MYPVSVCLCIRWLSRDTQQSAHSEPYGRVLRLSIAASCKFLTVFGSRITSGDVTLSCFTLRIPPLCDSTTPLGRHAIQLLLSSFFFFPSCQCSGLLSDLISISEKITNFLSSLFLQPVSHTVLPLIQHFQLLLWASNLFLLS